MNEYNLNPFEILKALRVQDVTSATRVTGGWDTTIWKVELREKACALRVFPARRTEDATREAETMRAARSAGLAVPEILAEGTWNDRPALLLSWCSGHTLMDEMRARPWAIRRLGFTSGRQQAAMHQVTLSGSEPPEADWITRFGPVDDELRERLLSLNLQPDRLLHLDYHPLNVMVVSNEISGILDWANAMPGDPRADVARTWSILRLMPLSAGRPEPVTEAARRLLAAGWLRGYERAAGPLRDMEPFKIWAGMAMLNDLAPKIGKPGVWVEQRHLDEIERRVTTLRKQSGLPAGFLSR